jgi:hypothetical protein
VSDADSKSAQADYVRGVNLLLTYRVNAGTVF